ncbi:MAG: hypothetical protein CVU97_00050 [Firmicutes bacterium HGW-Firmicutes-21]|nr:MAG: hypothetical protein CVU97_00050 [Firmicutes bacterium HGW-Firmicutes-21]
MQSKNGLNRAKKRDIMIAVLLFSCVMLSVSIGLLLPNFIGAAVNIDGSIENIRVSITEVCARNRSIICDSTGEYNDYIELYNAGVSFNMLGFALTDSANKQVKYVFDTRTFSTGQYMVIFLDGKNVPFSLKSEGGETVSLLSPDGVTVASVKTVETEIDMVMSLQNGKYVLTYDASPGYPNTPEGIAAYKLSLTDGANTLVISELLTNNKSALPDKSGAFSDIIEINNTTPYDIPLNGWYLSDKTTNPHRYALPDITLNAGEYIIIYASGEGKYKDGEIHASFKLSTGEHAVLAGPNGKYSSVEVEDCGDNVSLCRVIDDDGSVVYKKMSPSLGFENTEDGMYAFADSRIDHNAALVITEVLLDTDELAYGGALNDVIEITNVSSGEVSTADWFMSDDINRPYKYKLPELKLKPGECIVIIADGGNNTDGDKIHANFSLSQGETLYLFTPDKKQGLPLDIISAGRGNSWQYGTDSGYLAAKPSIGFTNNSTGRAEFERSVRPRGIEISEAVSVNTKYIPGPYATYHDFIELHNNSDSSMSLAGMYLSDDGRNMSLAALPDVTVPAGGYIVFILSSDGINTPSGYTVLPFSLAAVGETVYLSNGSGVVDCMVIPPLTGSAAFGRANGEDGFNYLAAATPKAANSYAISETAPQPVSSVKQGVYNDVQSLKVELNGKGTIRYTLDSTEPNATSAVYNGAIILTRTTVIRARSFADGYLPGKVLDLLYVINEGHELEIISLITNPSNLWDYYSGIYVKGPNASSEFPYVGANYWQNWEKEATVSFFANDGTSFSEPCGLRIFGAYSRALDMKSFSCAFRAQYGTSQLNYKLFKNSDLSGYESFILRNTGQDFNRARMRDPLITSLVSDATGMDVQKYRPAVVYLNGEFWGVYFIREKINENYIAGNYNVSASSVTTTRANGVTSTEYTALIIYVKTHNLAVDEYYQYVLTQIDKENYIDYICAQIYIANTDNGNIRFYKSTDTDGKWRWIMFDTDWSFSGPTHQTVARHLNPEGTGSQNRFSTALINALLKNPSFKEDFLRRMAWQLENIWTTENVTARITEIKELIRHDMVRDCEKWGRTYTNWQNHVDSLITFQKNRPAEIYKQMKSYFSLSDAKMAELGYKI